MEYMEEGECRTASKILCCQCAVPIEPNPANTCVACLRTQVDITEGIPKHGQLYFCKFCERYLQPPNTWLTCALESRELLSLCMKKIKGINLVRLVDAGFVWTEPHSKRIKVKLTIQKEVNGGAILQQTFVVEFTVNNQMCDTCRRREAKDFWKAVVQVRQKISHKKTFLYLEQIILKHGAHTKTVRIKEHPEGVDFYFANKSDAKKLVEFIVAMVPCKYKTSQELISHDTHSNTYNYKYTFSVEIVPICKDNIVCLPRKLSQQLGNMGPLAVCFRVTGSVQLVDPSNLKVAEISSNLFWRSPFQSLCTPSQLREFFILHVELADSKDASSSEKFLLADVWVAKVKEVGISDQQIHTKTHLGHLLNPGDTALGFDFTVANVNDSNFEKLKPADLPDVILVKKVYADRKKRSKHRNWKLKKLNRETAENVSSCTDGDFGDFMEDLEEDKVLRKHVNVYFNPPSSGQAKEELEDGVPRIALEEMLQNLDLESDPEAGAMAMD